MPRLLAVLSLAACTQDPRARFEADVVPVLETGCTASQCHGVGPSAEADGDVIDWKQTFFHTDGAGHITDLDAAYETAKAHIVTDDPAEFSMLIRKPLAQQYGGLSHYGGAVYPSPDDAGYVAIRDWIESEQGGGLDVQPLTEREQQFADDVQPVLTAASCMNSGCHGTTTAVPFKFDPGIGGVFSREATRTNYTQSKLMLSLDGDPLQSRLLRKGLPLNAGGIIHKGGNRQFFTGTDDPRLGPVLDWICAEREDATGEPCLERGDTPIRGFVYVAGPLAPEPWFAFDDFTPGTDLFLATVADASLVPNGKENLTAQAHAAPADVREPAVDPTGNFVAFAMRTSLEKGHELWLLDLRTRELRQLTTSPGIMAGGALWTDREPTFGPDGTLWFISTRSGEVADEGLLNGDLWELDLQTGDARRRSYTAHVERKPSFYKIGHETFGQVCFTTLRAAIPGQRRASMHRFPPGLLSEYHPQFGVTAPEQLFTDMREMPDGRYTGVIGDPSGVWGGGRLGVLDRNFGPELHQGEPSVPVYSDPLVRLDPTATAVGVTSGLYRDAAPLPDGRVLTAYAPGPLDLADPEASFDLGISVLTYEESTDGSGPTVVKRVTLIDEPGVQERDPELIYAAQVVPITPMAWDPTKTTAIIRHNGVGMIDQLLGALPPTGPRTPTAGVAAIRAILWLPTTPDQWPGATLGKFGPTLPVAEIPLTEDGTLQVEVPANIAVRFEGIDANGMMAGQMHNRWYDVQPGQLLAQGVTPDTFPMTCAVCHGALDGDRTHVAPNPDVMTSASLTLARYDGQNPRRPLPVPKLAAEMFLPVDFATVIQPIFDRACVACHSGADPAAALDLSNTPDGSFNTAYRSLYERELVDQTEGSARRSRLTEVLLGEEFDAPGSPPAGHPTDLDDTETRAILRWLDVGAPWRGLPW